MGSDAWYQMIRNAYFWKQLLGLVVWNCFLELNVNQKYVEMSQIVPPDRAGTHGYCFKNVHRKGVDLQLSLLERKARPPLFQWDCTGSVMCDVCSVTYSRHWVVPQSSTLGFSVFWTLPYALMLGWCWYCFRIWLKEKHLCSALMLTLLRPPNAWKIMALLSNFSITH